MVTSAAEAGRVRPCTWQCLFSPRSPSFKVFVVTMLRAFMPGLHHLLLILMALDSDPPLFHLFPETKVRNKRSPTRSARQLSGPSWEQLLNHRWDEVPWMVYTCTLFPPPQATCSHLSGGWCTPRGAGGVNSILDFDDLVQKDRL